MAKRISRSEELRKIVDGTARKIQKRLDARLHKLGSTDGTTMVELNLSQVDDILNGYWEMRREHRGVLKFIELAKKI